MSEFLFLRTADFGEDDYRRMLALCGAARRDKVARIRDLEEKKLSILAEGILRVLLGTRLSLPPESLVFETAPGGKPYLVRSGKPDEKVHFSISHTCRRGDPAGGRLLLALSNTPVGCDIEGARLPSPGLLRKVCAPAELAYIGEGDGMALRFAEVWTAKEAYVKCTGVGVACDLRAVEVCRKAAGYVPTDTVCGLPLRHFLREDFACAVCGGGGTLREISL